MAEIKFVYFDLRARGEPVRLVLAAAGKQWNDVRISFEQWPQEKPNAPFGQLPYVIYKGKSYGQSVAIAAFFAREFGLYGKSNLDALRIDEVIGLSVDYINTIYRARFENDATKKAELYNKLFDEETSKFLSFFEKLLKENDDSGYFVGSAVTLADLFVYNVLDAIIAERSDIAESFPESVKKLRAQVETDSNLKEYLANRKPVPF